MFKLLLVSAFCTVTLAACEKQKQATPEVGAIPKTIIDKATNDISNAEALTAVKMRAVENVDTPADTKK